MFVTDPSLGGYDGMLFQFDEDGTRDLAWLLVLENLVFTAEAEVRWLDHVETRLHRESLRPQPRRAPADPAATNRTETTGARR